MNKRGWYVWILGILAAGVLLVVGMGVIRRMATGEAAAIRTNKDAELSVPVAKDDPTWGDPNAPVTIVEFSDYQCPYCRRLEDTMHQLRESYGPKQIRIVWKNYPLGFHLHARPAAIASATVFGLGGEEAFWRFHQTLFAHQGQLDRDHFIQWAKDVGVDENAFRKALDENRFANKVEKDMALGKKLGVRGTPYCLVNGIPVKGAQPYTEFQKLVDKQLELAKKLRESGVKAKDLYARLLERNKREVKKEKTRKELNRLLDKIKKPKEDKTTWKVPVGSSPIRGPKDALVTIVLFSDFQCPFCKRVEPTLDKVMEHYKGKVRIVWKDRPLSFHRRAEACAEFARTVRELQGDKGFWKAHDLLFESNPKLEDEDLERVAKKLSVPWDKIKKAIDEAKYTEQIDEDLSLAERLHANGTPQMFINGRRLVGAVPFETFQKLIDEQLAKAKNLVDSGVPASKVYEKLMEKAKEPPPAPPPPRKELPKPGKDNPWKGSAHGPLVLQLVSDFQCPFCRRVEPTIAQLAKKYASRLKVVWIDNPLPFHDHAMLAAEAAREVFVQRGNKGFWKYHDMLFEHQRDPGGLEREALERYAEQLGCDMNKFRKALDNHTHRKFIENEQEMVAQADIRGTPGIVINGYFVSGAQPMAVFERAIRRATKDLRSHKKPTP